MQFARIEDNSSVSNSRIFGNGNYFKQWFSFADIHCLATSSDKA